MMLSVDIRDALELKNLPVPKGMHILKIEAEDYTNWEGEQALRIFVLLDEATEVEKLDGNEIGTFKLAVHDNLQQYGINLFPYFSFAKPSELAAADEE